MERPQKIGRRRLLKWLEASPPEIRTACPTLIVDDEADQASVNTGSGDTDRPAVNRAVLQLLRLLPRIAYVGYTATPFANVFVDPTIPDDLYPRDFIVDLPRPTSYFGAERIFADDCFEQRIGKERSERALSKLTAREGHGGLL